jgi:hypothetical protein
MLRPAIVFEKLMWPPIRKGVVFRRALAMAALARRLTEARGGIPLSLPTDIPKDTRTGHQSNHIASGKRSRNCSMSLTPARQGLRHSNDIAAKPSGISAA